MARRLLNNVLALGGAQLVTMACSLITGVILARSLGPAVYGLLGFGIALLSYFGLLVNMGMDVHSVREIARQPTHGLQLVKMVILTRLVFAALLFLVLILALPYFGWSERLRDVLLIQGMGLFGVALIVDFFFQAEQRLGIVAFRQGGAAVVGMLAVIILIREPNDLNIAAAIPVSVLILSALILLTAFWFEVDYNSLPEHSISRLNFLRRSAPVALMGVLMTIYINLDIVILGYMVAEAEVGEYVAASRVVIMAMAIPSLVHGAFLPALSKDMGTEAEGTVVARHLARTISYFGGAVGGFGILTAPAIISLLFGDAFTNADDALTILMAHAFLFYLTTAFSSPLLAWRCDKGLTIILIFGAAFNVGLNFLLIPIFGIEGAAAATLITQASIGIGMMVLAHRAFGLKHYGLIVRVLIVSLLSLAPIYGIIQLWPAASTLSPWVGLITLGGGFLILYVMLSAVAGIVTIADMRMLYRPTKCFTH